MTFFGYYNSIIFTLYTSIYQRMVHDSMVAIIDWVRGILFGPPAEIDNGTYCFCKKSANEGTA